MASRRKRGPVTLRLQLWLDLPLSVAIPIKAVRRKSVNSGLYLIWGRSNQRKEEGLLWVNSRC